MEWRFFAFDLHLLRTAALVIVSVRIYCFELTLRCHPVGNTTKQTASAGRERRQYASTCSESTFFANKGYKFDGRLLRRIHMAMYIYGFELMRFYLYAAFVSLKKFCF